VTVDALQRWLTLVTLVAAALAALGYLIRITWGGFVLVKRIHDLVEHELTANSGSSMKDDVAAMARALGGVQRDLIALTEDKELAHQVLQLQLDTVADALGLPRNHPQHRREDHAT
jgi:hypothetical protein